MLFRSAVGDTVTLGQAVAVMEAMKMEHTLHAPRDGVVAELLYAVAIRWSKAVSCCGWKADRAPGPRRARPVSAGSSAAARTTVARATPASGQGRRVRCPAAGWC